MATVQLASRIDRDEERRFREVTRRLGTTPDEAVRVFVAAFNEHGGFPFDVRPQPTVEPFATEQEALGFLERNALRVFDE